MQKDLLDLELQNDAPRTSGETLLGIDYGTKYSGLAFSPDSIVTLPLEVVPTERLFERTQQLVDQKNCSKIIIGLPLSSDGSENENCAAIRSFSSLLQTLAPVELVNERYSSQQTLGPKNKRCDDLAAARILEYYLS